MLEKDVERAILLIIQAAILDARNLSYDNNPVLAADVLDAVDGIPLHLRDWKEDSLEIIQISLRCFVGRYEKIPPVDNQYLSLPRHFESLKQLVLSKK